MDRQSLLRALETARADIVARLNVKAAEMGDGSCILPKFPDEKTWWNEFDTLLESLKAIDANIANFRYVRLVVHPAESSESTRTPPPPEPKPSEPPVDTRPPVRPQELPDEHTKRWRDWDWESIRPEPVQTVIPVTEIESEVSNSPVRLLVEEADHRASGHMQFAPWVQRARWRRNRRYEGFPRRQQYQW